MPEIFLRIDLKATNINKSYPYRAWDLIEFLKLIKKDNTITAIEVDIDKHTITFMVDETKNEL